MPADDDHTVLVLGTHGSFLVDTRTGVPTGAVPLAYRDIVRWDVDEWHGSHLGETLIEAGYVDVLDLGGWLAEGTYAPPEPGFRAL